MSGNVPTNCDPNGGFIAALNCGSGAAADQEGQTANTLFTALWTAFASFCVQFLIFALLRMRLARIYRPRSYLVPEKERVEAPPRGVVGWIPPLFTTPNLSFIQKCGLDAYFFLRYLRMLLKIFVPMTVVVLPILFPINALSGDNAGLDQLSISNIKPKYTKRLWAHCLLALLVIVWVCYIIYRELRGYIRVRQAFLTSPQHRLKASATTVLVTGIPRKWLSMEALNGLYDVFPGGIRNIWINRDFNELADKISYRDSTAKSLEDAETNLVKMCTKKHASAEARRWKQEGKSKSKQEQQQDKKNADADAEQMAQGNGTSAGDQHTAHGLQEALEDAEEAEEKQHHRPKNPLGFVGQGVGAIGDGFETFGKGVGKLGRNAVGDVNTGFQKANDHLDRRAVAGTGFVIDDELYRSPDLRGDDVPPTPPPKTPMAEREARQQGLPIERPVHSSQETSQPLPSEHPHRFATVMPVHQDQNDGSSSTLQAQSPPSMRVTGPSIESSKPPLSPFQIEEPAAHQSTEKKWKIWKNNDRSIAIPSPQPHALEEDEFPLYAKGTTTATANDVNEKPKKDNKDDKEVYPDSFDKDWDEDQDGEPFWRRYLEPKEREKMRVPVFSPTWCPSLPLVGKKVDRIYYLRRELARLNLEIEMDQNDVEKFPYMNSAFIQFNHQVAAHMACQSLSHHVPQHMAPRIVEISPDDVIWDNMSIKWWESYVRSGVVLAICSALIIFYAIPVTFTSLLSKVSTLAAFKPFAWLMDLPKIVISLIQGPLPPLLLNIILSLVPVVFRLLVTQQGVPTGNQRELGVQQWYFAFLFIQVFLVVTITGGITSFITNLAHNPTQVVNVLAQNLPKASNYFFNYLSVQALSNSASALLQTGALLSWFIVAPLFDSTARAKWRRQTGLAYMQWGSFFPPFTNFAVIGIIYSVIAPMILPFMLAIFGLFWIVWRYNVLYVYQFRNDTGGLLFPVAINQLFVGLYVMQLCLIGFFFISRDQNGDASAIPQGVIMIVALLLTIMYQWLLNSAFQPLFQYLPITLEDEAVIRDEEFARAQASKFAPLISKEQDQNDEDARDIQDVLAEQQDRDDEDENKALERERRTIEQHRRSHRDSSLHGTVTTAGTAENSPRSPWHRQNMTTPPRSPWHQNQSATSHPSWHADRWRQAGPDTSAKIRNLTALTHPEKALAERRRSSVRPQQNKDVEAQHTVGDILFSGFADELEDLTPDERDLLVRYAFQHSALRAKRPVVWIPRDKLGVSDDEIKRAKKMSTVDIYDGEKDGKVEKTNIWMSNEGTALDGKGKVVYRRSPPDFSNVDLIAL